MHSKFFEKYNLIPVTVKASSWFVICNVIQKAMSVLTVPIITRLLNTSEYGIYSIFISYSNILIIFGTLSSFSDGYYVGIKKYYKDRFNFTSSIMGFMFFLTTVLLVIFLLFKNDIVKYTGLPFIVWILIFIWIYGQSTINLWFTENKYEFNYKPIVISTVFIGVATPLLKIFFILFFERNGIDKSLGAIIGFVSPILIIGIVAAVNVVLKGKLLFIKKYWKFVLFFNIPLMPHYLSQIILNHADKIMIERLDNMGDAGIYSVAYSLSLTMTIINVAINGSFIPWEYQNLEKGSHHNIAKITNIIMVMLAGLNLLLIFIAPEIMNIFASKEYISAIYVIPPVAIGVLVMWLTQIFINVEFYFEKNKLVAFSSILSAALNIILNLIAIPKFGYLAAGYTTLCCYLINMVFHSFASIRLLKSNNMAYPFNLQNIVLLTLISISIMFIATFLYSKTAIRYTVILLFVIIAVIKNKTLKSQIKDVWATVKNLN